jgi:Uma2 family endonuclease
MAQPNLHIPVSEYLNSTYRPDRDYVNGQLKERTLGDTSHATVQGVFFAIFLANRTAWGVRPFAGQRIQISPNRFRIVDVCVLCVGKPPGGIIQTQPLVCIEILSLVQSLSDMQECVDDYLGMGVDNVWIIDPVRRYAWYATVNGPVRVSDNEFSIPDTPIKIALADIYGQLDEMAAGR